MAGRRQHIIPQFLLRNFAAKIQGGDVSSWVYRKGKSPFCTNIKNTAVEGYFYGNPNDAANSADDLMTSQEGPFARVISELLDTPPSPIADGSQIGPFITHMSGRTKNLRLAFAESAGFLIGELRGYFKNPSRLPELVKNHMQKPGVLDEFLQNKLPPALNTPTTRRAFGDFIVASLPGFFAQHGDLLVQQLDVAFERMLVEAPRAAADGQIKALQGFANDCPKAELFGQLHWETVKTADALLLGDSGCLFKLAGDEILRPFPEKPGDIETVFLPISTTRLLVGSKSKESPQVNVEQLNVSSARCSREYFVSACDPERHGRFQKLIGEGAVFFTLEQIKVIAGEVFTEVAKPII